MPIRLWLVLTIVILALAYVAGQLIYSNVQLQNSKLKDIINQPQVRSSSVQPYKWLRVPILNYHHISPNPAPDVNTAQITTLLADFEKQMQYLAENNYTTITLGQLKNSLDGKNNLPARPIILTFDDGYVDFYTDAYPILQKYQHKAYMALISDFVGKTANYLTWDQVRQMKASGLVDFMAHSRHHKKLTELSPGEMDYEIAGSKQVIESQLSGQVDWFVYPYGSLNNQTIDLVKKAGFVGALGTNHSNWQSMGIVYNLRRVHVGDRGWEEFTALLTR
ncbi:polysaccharide deacetylase family protein [Candidatus Daviesbacteria bacterium]|nr:polysaccharide deacetylase family protein [Candidatus Daviesbacteria bacterium]